MSLRLRRLEVLLWLFGAVVTVICAYTLVVDYPKQVIYAGAGFFLLAAVRFSFLARKL